MAYRKPGDLIPLKGRGAKLSNKMISFIDEYMVDMNAEEALRRSTYQVNDTSIPKQAKELMEHPLVAAEISRRMMERRQKTELTAEYLVNKLVQMIETNEIANPNAALRAIELAGKSIGLYKERQEISGPDGKAIEMEQRTQENAADFARRISVLAERNGTSNVVKLPERSGTGGT